MSSDLKIQLDASSAWTSGEGGVALGGRHGNGGAEKVVVDRTTTSISPSPPGFSPSGLVQATGSAGAGIPPPSAVGSRWATTSGQGSSQHSELMWSESLNQPLASVELRGGDGRSSSFKNLAAALGSGLAESMEDATRGDQLKIGAGGGAPVLTDNFFNPSNDLTYERHKRHAASRLLGAGTASSSSHMTPEAGSLFGAFDAGERGRGGEIQGASALYSNILGAGGRDQNGRENPSSSLPTAASFSSDAGVVGSGAYLPPSSYDDNYSLGDGKGRSDHRSRLPVTKDLGLTVMEPTETRFGGSVVPTPSVGLDRMAKSHQDGTYGIQRGMENLWSDSGHARNGSRSPKPSDRSVDSMDGNQIFNREPKYSAEEELRPFTWDINHHEPSRALAILRVTSFLPNDIQSLCESFGVVEAFRADFLDRGVVFVSYFDMRCAQFAAMQLPSRLQRLGAGPETAIVKFCVPLTSSSQNDDSLVVINDLPNHMSVDSLAQILSSYGAIRSLKNVGGNYHNVSSFVAEFHDVQDARHVVLELDSTQPWGPDVSVEVGNRNPSDRKKGRELLALIGRWRGRGGGQMNRSRQPVSGADVGMYRQQDPSGMGHRDVRYDRGVQPGESATQFVLGPDGRYSYNNTYPVHPPSGYPPYGGIPPTGRHQGDHVVHTTHGTYMTHHVNHPPPPPQQQFYSPQHPQRSPFSGGSSVVSGGSHHSGHRSVPGYYGDDRSIGSHSNVRSVPTHIGSLAGSTSDGNNQHLMLDLDVVENGMDTRTSLMVRNIPNKYTQQMLLSEFTENGHGPGIIDFFYLPIDFKNRCNRGYAFINFVDYGDILLFHRQYYGKHWRTFNSDKICDITYARIQGKGAMLKRFENSALMEKDDEYKPLVFVSNGQDTGKRLPFPDPSNKGGVSS
jgi:hypothetical protein